MKYYYNLKELFSMWIYCQMSFVPVISCLIQSSVSHDPLEIIIICWFDAQEKNLIIINVENQFYFIFRILWWIESSKEQHLYDTEHFCMIVNVFTITFVQVYCIFVQIIAALVSRRDIFHYCESILCNSCINYHVNSAHKCMKMNLSVSHIGWTIMKGGVCT